MSRAFLPSGPRRYRVDVDIPLAIHLPPRGTLEDSTPGAPLCLADVIGRVTITHSGRLRVSIQGAIILDTYSEPHGDLYMHGRCQRFLDALNALPRPGDGLKIKAPKKETNDGK